MDIRFCNKNDIGQIRNIWEYCFNDSPEYVDFYFEKKFNPETTLVLDDDGKLISSIHLNQHNLNLNFKDFEVSYVVGVSTLPEARGTGRMRELMETSLRAMYNSGQEVAILMPIDFRLYTKYGFENCYDMLVQEVDVSNLKKFRISGDFRKADSAKDIYEIYRYALSRYNGYSIRSESYFDDFIEEMEKDGGYIYVNYIDNVPEGYIAYSIDGDVMVVRECYYRDIKSYKSMLKFIFNHNTQVKRVEIYSAVDDSLRHMLDNPKDSKFEIKPFMMGRVINFEKLISRFEAEVEDDFMPFKIAIKDEYIEENSGIFEFYIDGNKVSSKKIGSIDEIEDIDLFSINEISALFFGYMSVEEVDFMREEKLSCIIEMKELIDSIYSYRGINHINEYV